MRVLLVYPRHPASFWSFHHALQFIGKRATQPPLGLLTVAGMLPAAWEKELVDMNVASLSDEDLRRWDLVFISAMSVQKESAVEVIARCRDLGVKTVVGGPLFTTEPDQFPQVDHLVLNEAEITLPLFLEDLQNGCAKRLYASRERPDVDTAPLPAWDLLDVGRYASMSLQYSRGCPFDCEFCSISTLYGHKVRTKSKDRLLAELEALRARDWKGDVFFVDDNFIGNKGKLKREILPAMVAWMEANGHPFAFTTEASIDLADDEELMRLMVRAGFESVFVGIESPNDRSLEECNKLQNRNRDLLDSVKTIQRAGLQVTGGFIVGFDSDTPSIFESLRHFIEASGIVSAMVGLLNAPCNTRLYRRMVHERRLLSKPSGDNTDFSINFVPKMNYETLISGYRRLICQIYAPRPYYQRVMRFLRDYKPLQKRTFRVKLCHVGALLRSIVLLGVAGEERWHYWRLFFWTIFRRPRLLPLAITFAVYGRHFRKVFDL